MPGLIEGHSHPSFPNSYNFNIPPEEHTLITMRGVQTLLDAGYTSLFSAASAKVRLDVVIRNEINAGRLIGPRMRAAGPEITCPGGLGDGIVQGLHVSDCFGYRVTNVKEICDAVNLMIDQGVDTIKLNISGEEFTEDGNDIKSTLSEEQVKAACAIAKERGCKIAAHCRGSESVIIAARNGVDAIFHCDYTNDEGFELLLQNKERIFLGPAIGLMDKLDHKKAMAQSVTYKKLKQLAPDLRVVIGGDYGFPETIQGTNAHDLVCFVKYFDYTPIEALVCATNYGGQLMGMPVGLLKEGYLADMILVEGNPTESVDCLTDRDNIKMIVLDGWVYKNQL